MLLVSILGDFHSSIFPIYYEFKDSISTHIVVHDDALGELVKSKKVLTSLDKFNQQNNINIKTKDFRIDEDSLESILKLIEHIESHNYNAEEIYINITDGLSNIGTVLGAKLLDKGVKLLSYDIYENNYNITTKDNIVTKKVTSQMSIKEHFLLKGLHVSEYDDKRFAHKNEAIIRELFEQYYKELVILKRDITQNNYIDKSKYPRAIQLINLMNLDFKKDQKTITGSLFEYYIYLLIKDLGFDDIELGVIVDQEFSKEHFVKNEFDILLMKDNHLHMIECKFTKYVDMQLLVYKYSSLINLVDDDGKIIVLTDDKSYKHDLYSDYNNKLHNHRRGLLNKVLIRGSVFSNKEQFIDDIKSNFNLY